MTNEVTYTSRGFKVYSDFQDLYDNRFTIQESSLAEEYCLWVGSHENRGHLTVEMAKKVRDKITDWLREVEDLDGSD